MGAGAKAGQVVREGQAGFAICDSRFAIRGACLGSRSGAVPRTAIGDGDYQRRCLGQRLGNADGRVLGYGASRDDTGLRVRLVARPRRAPSIPFGPFGATGFPPMAALVAMPRGDGALRTQYRTARTPGTARTTHSPGLPHRYPPP